MCCGWIRIRRMRLLQRLFPKLGYELAGEIGLGFRPGLRFLCYEKRLGVLRETSKDKSWLGKVLHSHPSQKLEGWGTSDFVAGFGMKAFLFTEAVLASSSWVRRRLFSASRSVMRWRMWGGERDDLFFLCSRGVMYWGQFQSKASMWMTMARSMGVCSVGGAELLDEGRRLRGLAWMVARPRILRRVWAG